MSSKMDMLKLEGRQKYINPQNVNNSGNFRRPNNASQISPREQRNEDINDQNIHIPLQNNLVTNDEVEDEGFDPEIHCLGYTSSFPH
jgi:hypothetical protein